MAKHFSVEWLSQSFYSPVTCSYTSDDRIQSKINKDASCSCGYTSSSESEVGDIGEGESGANRRMRTKFTSDQIFRLEKTFSKHKYLGATQRRKIAEKLQLSETQVKTWFQNRRMKLKRDVQDMRADYLAPSKPT
ncbi:ventral expressed homeobox [Sardina pilchardus]|uniref:ventral expressed homeobox n=1 Tax=Sardina pilchardus TaxID=27697 RepID=UPI002E119EBA